MKTAFQHQRNKHLVQSVFEQLLFYYEADYLTHLEWANQSRSIFLALGMLGKKSCRFIIDFSKSACQFKLMKTDFQHQRNKHLVQSVFEKLLFYYEADYLTHLEWANQSRSIFLALGMFIESSCQFVIYFSKSACQFKLMKTAFQNQRNKHLVLSVFEHLLFYYEADYLTHSEWA
jgi:hypothetical protein